VIVRTVTGAAELEPAGWDRMLGPGDLYLSSRWLGVVERVGGLRPSYLLAVEDAGRAPGASDHPGRAPGASDHPGRAPGASEDAGASAQALAGLTVHELRPESPPWPFYRLDLLLPHLLRKAAGPEGQVPAGLAATAGRTMPMALLGGRQPAHQRLLVRPGLDEREAGGAAGAVLDAAMDLAAAGGVRTASFLYVDAGDRRLRGLLDRGGFETFPSATAAVMPIPWDDLSGYLRSFRGHRRRRIESERRRLAAAGITFHDRAVEDPLIPELAALEVQHEARYGVEDTVEQASRAYRLVNEAMGGSVRALTAEAGGRVRAFVVVVPWHDELFLRQAGFDYAFQGRLPLYFGLVFYHVIEYAIAHGIRTVYYSIESERAKASRGCRLVPQIAYVRALDPDLAPGLAAVAGHLRSAPAGPA
jgi:uncharacterized protein